MCLYEVNNWEREVCIRKSVRCMGVCDGLGAWEVRSFHTIRSGIIIYFLLSFFANCTYPFNQDGGRERIQKAREWKRKGDTETVSESTCLGCVMMSRRQNKRNNWSHERKCARVGGGGVLKQSAPQWRKKEKGLVEHWSISEHFI